MGTLWRRPRVLLGIGAGIALGFGAAFLIENYMLAAVLGSLAAIGIGGLEEVKECTLVGLVTGAGVGLARAAAGEPLLGGAGLPEAPLRTIAHLLATMTIVGLACASYGFLIAKLKPLYDEGRGPFF